MTVLNAWCATDASGSRAVRWGLVDCDDCVIGHCRVGSAEILRGRGWRFDDFEAGPHWCPSCAKGGKQSRANSVLPFEPGALPNLLIIGAAKCGTTSMHRYLEMHPQVQMSRSKELNFFQSPTCLRKLDAYSSRFDASAPVRGESSPIYTCHPITSGVPMRIRTTIPEVRMIYLVRDPVERFTSHYLQNRATGMEPRKFDAVLEQLDNPYNEYVVRSRYATQLEQYLKIFPSEQLLVLDLADLRERRGETLRRALGFLGIDDAFVAPGWNERHNISGRKRRKTSASVLLRRSRLADVVRQLPRGPRRALLGPAKRLLDSGVKPPHLDEGTRERLRDVFREDVQRLREMTGQEFAAWTV